MTEAQTKPSLLTQMGGVAGMGYAGLPSVVFVIANAAADLRAAVMLGVGAGAGIAGLRLLRREPLQPALSGLLGVAVGAVIAYRTGDAKDFFVVGIWASLLLALVFLASILVRRPLVGVIWSALNGSGQAWRTDRTALIGYDIATLAVTAVFAARFVVQNWLYSVDATDWLAFARIAMGYPLMGVALVVVVWAVRRSGRRGAAHPADA